jgi:hypothetical protein
VATLDSRTSYASLNCMLTEAARLGIRVLVSDDQAKALYRRWNTALATRFDYALELSQDEALHDLVVAVWLEVKRERPVLRAVLDQCSHRATLRPTMRHGQSLLGVATGLSSVDDDAKSRFAAGQHD